ncbi:hypothetical protein SD77_0077 [Bacillus badius]|uniref:Uncharacterized protein n=1 Tax=Bacillus badius TaxID=1455 RepID=A0ABR5AZV8_BACBA|nr:hypothetical protein SD78_3405 [Bacillus badius]KIL80229.1 hypothetical protein SD77_0077 [Bacillus badius]
MYIFIPFVKNSSFYCFFHQRIRHELDEGRFFLKEKGGEEGVIFLC